jgi:RNase H-like domain found in reverse transcriptase
VKFSKCAFGVQRIDYLGHVISYEDVVTDPNKIITIKEWPIPKIVKQLREFLRLTGYYRKFIKDYGLISRPLTELLKKNSFNWEKEAQLAFNTFKEALASAPMLALPDFTKKFVVES